MLVKPEACRGCPLYQDGRGFVPDEIIPGNNATLVMGQNPGNEEVQQGRPFVGKTGQQMEQEFFPLAKLRRGENVDIANTFRCRWKGGNTLPPEKVLNEAIQHCQQAYPINKTYQLVVAQGATAWDALGQQGTITDWRGYLGEPSTLGPVYGVLHLSDLNYNPTMRLVSRADWRKIARIRAGEWPRPIPEREMLTHSSSRYPKPTAQTSYLAIDTEYNPETLELQMLGIGWPGGGVQLRGYAVQSAGTYFCKLIEDYPVVFQNAAADIPVLKAAYGPDWSGYRRVDDTMLLHAVLWSEWPHDLEFLASIYGQYPKMKHLSKTDKWLYNWGDVIETMSVWEALRAEVGADPQTWRIYEQQSLPLLPVILYRQREGIYVDQKAVKSAYRELSARLEALQEQAKAYAGWPINLGSDKQLGLVVYGYEGMAPVKGKKTKKPTLEKDAIAVLRGRHLAFDPEIEEQEGHPQAYIEERIAQGAHPLLELRAAYTKAETIVSNYLSKMRNVEWIFPQFHIHAQASGRWSTVNPPISQLPRDLRSLLIPAPKHAWISWDWDQIELRLLAALAGDTPLLTAFENKWDIHTLNACDIFGIPYPDDAANPHTGEHDAEWRAQHHWQGKDDIRRHFAKRFVYRLNYGGRPEQAGDIPGAKQLGLTVPKLVAASTRFLAAHPALSLWRTRVLKEAYATRESRTFMGRRRRLTGEKGIERAAWNHPMQGGVADIFNMTVLKIRERGQDRFGLRFVYGMFDSQTWEALVSTADAAQDLIKEILDAPWMIMDSPVIFPYTMSPIRYSPLSPSPKYSSGCRCATCRMQLMYPPPPEEPSCS